MKKIERTTLLIVDCLKYGRAISSIKKSMEKCSFERVVFFTDVEIEIEGVEFVKIPTIRSKDEYSHFILKSLWKHIKTDFVLIQQWDSWILEPDEFDERLYEVDYAGALWPEQDSLRNGNGGFSWRSKRLLDIVGQDDFVKSTAPEDVQLCRVYRPYLEKTYGLIWADDLLCESFSFELATPIRKTFGFHSFFHSPYRPTVIITRNAALGDCVQCEPVLAYFYKKGYRVVFDTLPQFHNIFLQHYFKVHRLEEVDPRILQTAKKYDLDFSYESKPRQLHLKTYFEFCEVPESEMLLQNPVLHLNIPVGPATKLFKKYCVLHIQDRKQTSRNIQGNIDWAAIVKYLKSKGYDSIQLSGGEDIEGALRMQTPGEPFLCWVIREADLMISIDSGPSNIAVSFGVPAVIFVGSVDLKYIYADLSNICVIEKEPNCGNEKCWHNVVGCEGMDCIVNKDAPPCVDFNHEDVVGKIDLFIKKIENK